MPRSAVSRIARAGCASGNACNWARMSGDASKRIQRAPSALTATDDCVRARALMRLWRKPSQLRQLQFHCGNPPPAADPRTCTLTMAEGKSATGITGRGPTQRVKAYIGKAGFGPHHGCPPGRVEDRLNLSQGSEVVFSNPVRAFRILPSTPRI